eukprot:5137426-Pleurochrysis_carterae.AAC.1
MVSLLSFRSRSLRRPSRIGRDKRTSARARAKVLNASPLASPADATQQSLSGPMTNEREIVRVADE